MKRGITAGLVAGCLLAGVAVAQVRTVQPLRQIVAPPSAAGTAPVAVADREKVLERRLTLLAKKNRALEGRVATLEGALREMRAASEFTCANPTTSRNGQGASENCTPLACNYLDGRCRTSAASSDHCAPGFV